MLLFLQDTHTIFLADRAKPTENIVSLKIMLQKKSNSLRITNIDKIWVSFLDSKASPTI